jgi:hypothetical protein
LPPSATTACEKAGLSWNYDLQFEIAYYNRSHLSEIQTELGIVKKGGSDTITNKQFKIYKINSSAEFMNGPDTYKLPYFKDRDDLKHTDFDGKFVKFYENLTSNPFAESSLSFAWETVRFGESFWMSITKNYLNASTENTPTIEESAGLVWSC